MTQEMVLDLMRRGMILAAETAAPMLGIGMVVGLLIAIFQAATQLQESSLNFVPKLVAIGLATTLLGPWMLDNLVQFSRDMVLTMPTLAPGMQ